MLLQGKKTGLLVEDLAAALKEEAYLQNVINYEEADLLYLMIADQNRVNHPLELSLLVEEQRADQRKGNEENQKGGVFLLPEPDLEMIFSLDVRDQKKPAHSDGHHPEEDLGLPSEGDLVHHSDAAGLQEGEAGLLGGGIEVGGVDLGFGGGLGHGVVVDVGVEAKLRKINLKEVFLKA